MKDFSPIEPIVQRICDTAVEALARFYELTEFPPDWMHESFMASYVFERLGEETSMMPEVMVSTLWAGTRQKEAARHLRYHRSFAGSNAPISCCSRLKMCQGTNRVFGA